MQLMIEADRRGILPPDKKVLLDEAIKRGIVKTEDDFGAQLPRQLGLTARAGIQGVADTAGTLAEPIRYAMNLGGFAPWRVPSGSEAGVALANMLGLPKPESRTEKIAGKTAEMMAGGGGLAAGARKIAAAIPEGFDAARNVVSTLGANPGMQTLSAGAAGAAGEYTKETGGNAPSQFLAALAAGVAAPVAASGVKNAVTAAGDFVKNLRPGEITVRVDNTIRGALPENAFNELPQHVRASIRRDVEEALRAGPVSDAAVRRLVDYRLTGATPTRAGLTQDPIDITRQQNLAKQGANSTDETAQLLARTENQNARILAGLVTDLGGGDQFANMGRVTNALGSLDSARQRATSELYGQARDSLGRAVPLDHVAFSRAANLALDEAMAGSSLPPAARQILNDITTEKIPLNVQTKEQMASALYRMGRGAGVDDQTRHALNIVRNALDNAPLTETHGLGPDALAAFRAARDSHAARMGAQERVPALGAVANGEQPDRLFQRFILGGSVRDVTSLRNELQNTPEALAAIRREMANYLRTQGGLNAETGQFNQASFNKALDAIGNEKLRLFFTPEQVQQLRAVGRVASYEQAQPKGTAVNNSNTAGAVFGLLERIANAPVLNRIPFGRAAIQEPLQNIVLGVGANKAANVPGSLLLPAQAQEASPAMSMAIPGLLVAPNERKKEKGLLVE